MGLAMVAGNFAYGPLDRLLGTRKWLVFGGNGLMLACTRGMYSLAARNEGLRPEVFKQIDPITNMPANSSIFGLLLAGFWLLYFYGANLTAPWFGFFCFDSSELPIVTIYASYIPIFLSMMKKETDLPTFKRVVMPTIALVGCVFMIIAAIFSHKMAVVAYLAIFLVFMGFGVMASKKK